MSVGAPTAGEVFTFRVYKEADISPLQVWANSYEVRASVDVPTGALDDLADKLVAFERAIHQDTARFNRVVISTWAPDGAPYNPASFRTVPLNLLGTVASPVSDATLPLQAVLFVKREVSSGRYGKLFYRRTLSEADVEGRWGELNLTPTARTAIISRVATALTSSALADHLAGGTSDLKLTLASGPGGAPSSIRDVLGLTVGGARLVRWNNRYYDKA